jgi:hypothetical protein
MAPFYSRVPSSAGKLTSKGRSAEHWTWARISELAQVWHLLLELFSQEKNKKTLTSLV